jgi:hypothetical protein
MRAKKATVFARIANELFATIGERGRSSQRKAEKSLESARVIHQSLWYFGTVFATKAPYFAAQLCSGLTTRKNVL